MIQEFNVNCAKFIYSKGELGYQEVLDDMQTTNRVAILTFNISEKNSDLFNCLKKVAPYTEITIITNIPNRWDTYCGDSFREIAHKKIKIYLSKLKPEEIGNRVNVYFNFDNHGKIILTDSKAYIGSSNFSKESANNIEFGFITYDKKFISYLFEELIPDIQGNSKPYYNYNYLPLSLEVKMAMVALHKLINELHDQTYKLHDDIDGKWWMYNNTEDILSVNTCEAIISLTNDLCAISSDVYDAIDVITNGSDECLDEIEDMRDELFKLRKIIEDLLESENIFDLAHYDSEHRMNELLQTEFAMDAYEENLEACIEKANEIITAELFDLADHAEDEIKELFIQLKSFWSTYNKIFSFFNGLELKKINTTIDNT